MSAHCPVHWEEGHSDYCTILEKDRHQQAWAWPWWQWGWECVPVSKALGAQDSARHQPRRGRTTSGRPSPLKTGLYSKPGAVHVRGGGRGHVRGPGAKRVGGGNERKNRQQGLRVRPSSKEGARRPSISELERIMN